MMDGTNTGSLAANRDTLEWLAVCLAYGVALVDTIQDAMENGCSTGERYTSALAAAALYLRGIETDLQACVKAASGKGGAV